MIRRWGLLLVGLVLLGYLAHLKLGVERQRVAGLMANGTRVTGWSEHKTKGRYKVTYAVAGTQRTTQVRCSRLIHKCPKGPVDVWVDPADAETIVITGGHYRLKTDWRDWLASLGIPATLLGFIISFTLRPRPLTNEPVTPRPYKEPRKRLHHEQRTPNSARPTR